MPVRIRCEIFRGDNLSNGMVYGARHVAKIVKETPAKIPLLRDHNKYGHTYGHVENFKRKGVAIEADITLNARGVAYMRDRRVGKVSMTHENRRARRPRAGTFINHHWFYGQIPSIPGGMTEVSLCSNPNCPTAKFTMPKRKRGSRKPEL